MAIIVAPSLLAADFSRLRDQVETVERGGAEWLHFDIMDGSFVPNISFGPSVISALRPHSRLLFDTHLMIEDPDSYLEDYRAAGSDSITVHQETCRHLHRTLTRIRELGARAGVAINPSTPVSTLTEVMPIVDLVLIMTVNPGFGGQRFIAETLKKVEQVRDLISAYENQPFIEVDGGVDSGTAAACVRAGATVLVAGTSVFRQKDPAAAVKALREAASPQTSFLA